jgi:hypothetical protein
LQEVSSVNASIHISLSYNRRPVVYNRRYKGMNPQESIARIGSAVWRLVVELFPKIRFGRAEMFFKGMYLIGKGRARYTVPMSPAKVTLDKVWTLSGRSVNTPIKAGRSYDSTRII